MTHSPSPADNLWQTKLAARLHDPAEKALVLLRDPEGHENGTSLAGGPPAGRALCLPPCHLGSTASIE